MKPVVVDIRSTAFIVGLFLPTTASLAFQARRTWTTPFGS
uniref:Uncharacterized protein n=1 Tax=Peronospora matthiolae TaxID=2874970 RepID=A0AAV1T456_9STRA